MQLSTVLQYLANIPESRHWQVLHRSIHVIARTKDVAISDPSDFLEHCEYCRGFPETRYGDAPRHSSKALWSEGCPQ